MAKLTTFANEESRFGVYTLGIPQQACGNRNAYGYYCTVPFWFAKNHEHHEIWSYSGMWSQLTYPAEGSGSYGVNPNQKWPNTEYDPNAPVGRVCGLPWIDGLGGVCTKEPNHEGDCLASAKNGGRVYGPWRSSATFKQRVVGEMSRLTFYRMLHLWGACGSGRAWCVDGRADFATAREVYENIPMWDWWELIVRYLSGTTALPAATYRLASNTGNLTKAREIVPWPLIQQAIEERWEAMVPEEERWALGMSLDPMIEEVANTVRKLSRESDAIRETTRAQLDALRNTEKVLIGLVAKIEKARRHNVRMMRRKIDREAEQDRKATEVNKPTPCLICKAREEQEAEARRASFRAETEAKPDGGQEQASEEGAA